MTSVWKRPGELTNLLHDRDIFIDQAVSSSILPLFTSVYEPEPRRPPQLQGKDKLKAAHALSILFLPSSSLKRKKSANEEIF